MAEYDLGTAEGTIKLDVDQAHDALKGVSKGLEDTHKSASKFGSGVGRTLKSTLKIGAAAIGGLSAAAVVYGKKSLDAYKESASVQAQTVAGLKSTKSAANVTAKQVSNLASTIRDYSGIDDEAVQSGENMLLTFTKVRNEVGKGNDIFNQATAAAADMSAKMGEDMSASALRLGKALNDPVKGASALRRVGVQLTDQQVEQIKHFVKAGDTMKAQKVILGELTTEFGGSAKAMGKANPAAIMESQIGDVQEQIGKAIMPIMRTLLKAIQPILKQLGPVITNILKALGPVFGALLKALAPVVSALLKGFTPVILGLVPIILALAPVIQQLGEALGQILLSLAPIVPLFADLLKVVTPLLPIIIKLATIIIDSLVKGLVWLAEAIANNKTLLTALAIAIGVVLLPAFIGWAVAAASAAAATIAAAAPVLALIAVIALLVAGIIYLVKHWRTIFNAIKNFTVRVFNAIKDFIVKNWKIILIVLTGGLATLIVLFISNWNKIKSAAITIWNGIKTAVVKPFTVMKNAIKSGLNWIRDTWSNIWNGMKSVASGIWDGILSVIKSGVNLVIDAINVLIKGYNLIPFHADIALIPHLEKGGMAEGLAVVGEKGPELAFFPQKTQVLSHDDSLALLRTIMGGAAGAAVRGASNSIQARNMFLRTPGAMPGFVKPGMSIVGTLELTSRSTAVVRGIVVDEEHDQAKFKASLSRMSRS